jgi:hypothetical protein
VTAHDVGIWCFLLALGYPFAFYAFVEIAWWLMYQVTRLAWRLRR